MSLQAVKAVEIGTGVESALSFGSAVHDEIGYNKSSEAAFHRLHPCIQSRRRN